MKSHLQSHAQDTSTFPAIRAQGDPYYKRPCEWKYRHDGAQRCCLAALFRAHDAGTLDEAAGLPCPSCQRSWQRIDGWWVIPQPAKRRPIARLRHGLASKVDAGKRGKGKPHSLRAQWFQKREGAKR